MTIKFLVKIVKIMTSLLNSKKILILIILFALFTRAYRLDYPNQFYFDEVYHAFTAKEFLSGNKEAWEWWTAPPPGVAYEWTHPPLAKELMAVSMFVVRSQEAWAWRLPGVLLGILSVYLIYILGMKLLKDQTSSLIAAFIFSIDGLNFVQSRIGMNDIYFITFMLTSLFFILNKKYFLSSIFLGFSLASKWTAVYFLPIYLLLILKEQQYLKLIYLSVIPPVIYLLSYIPFFLIGHTFLQFISLQQQMWWYHTGLTATHNYASAWWSWPLNLYPVWYFVDYKGDKIANIFATGNPVVFWTGTVAILLTTINALKRRSINLLIIVLGFFIFWLPWSLSPRIMFLYHFSPTLPFLSLALAYQLSLHLKDRRNGVYVLLILMTLGFILIFPFLTGLPIPKDLSNFFFLTNLGKSPF